jgi:hypothetical protein
MDTQLEAQRSRPPILKRAIAGLVLIGAVALGIYIVIGVIKAIFWTAVGILVVAGVLWALKTLIW